MAAFASGEADVLVATTVIEVGIDVPNATVMLVEGAERYGISQLHQLRGRVGRGEHASLCLLFGPAESARLKALEAAPGFHLPATPIARGPSCHMTSLSSLSNVTSHTTHFTIFILPLSPFVQLPKMRAVPRSHANMATCSEP